MTKQRTPEEIARQYCAYRANPYSHADGGQLCAHCQAIAAAIHAERAGRQAAEQALINRVQELEQSEDRLETVVRLTIRWFEGFQNTLEQARIPCGATLRRLHEALQRPESKPK